MKIKITNIPKVEEALSAVNGKARSFTVQAADIHALSIAAEAKMARGGLTQKARVGAVLTHRPAGPSANSYKYAAISTKIELTKTTGGWWLTGVERASVWPKESAQSVVSVSQTVADTIALNSLDGFRVVI